MNQSGVNQNRLDHLIAERKERLSAKKAKSSKIKRAKWLKLNPDKVKEYHKRYYKKVSIERLNLSKQNVESLHESYIKRIIKKGSDIDDIPEILIESKRLEIKLFRHSKL